MSIEKRYGKFRLSRVQITMNTEESVEIFKSLNFVPTKVQYSTFDDMFVYEGFSPFFEEVECLGHVAEYDVTVETKIKSYIDSVNAVKRT